MKKSLLLSFIFVFALVVQVLAQNRTVTGKVTDLENGQGLPGVTVLVKGTSTGTATGVDGGYSIAVPDGGTLVFRYVGYDTKEVAAGNQSVVNVQLAVATKTLNEVVVTGYGVQEKREVTGAITSIKGEVIEGLPSQTFDKALQGRAAGVQVTSTGGQPGGGISVNIRGTSTISGSTQPLYIIDGVQVASGGLSSQTSTNVLSSINPADIESIEILKDAAAASIYGSQAGNGVVIVTTKRGKAGKTKVKASMQYGVSEMYNPYDILNAEEWFTLRQESFVNYYTRLGYTREQALADVADEYYGGAVPEAGKFDSYNWVKAITQTGTVKQYELSLNGGDEKTRFYLSGSLNDTEGTIRKSSFTRGTVRGNLEHKVNDKFSVESVLSFSGSKSIGPSTNAGFFTNGAFTGALFTAPINRVYNEDGTYNEALVGTSLNIVQNIDKEEREGAIFQTVSNLAFNYDIIPGLRARVFGGIDFSDVSDRNYRPGDIPVGKGVGGSAFEAFRRNINYQVNGTLNYNKKLNDIHNVGMLVGAEFREVSNTVLSSSGQGFPSPLFPLLSNAATPTAVGSTFTGYKNAGIFTNMKYDYKDKYLVSGTLRYDGSSRFGADHRFGLFYGLSGGWRVTGEDFMQSVEILDDLKLRASYGVVGVQPESNFGSLGLYGAGGQYLGNPGLRPVQLAQPSLTWEESAQTNLGLDFALLNSKVYGSFDIYKKKITNLLLDKQLSGDSGYGSIKENGGEVEAKGIDFEVSTVNIDRGGFNWTSTFNVSLTENKLIALNAGKERIGNTFIVGEPLNLISGIRWAGVNPADGRPMFYDKNGNITYTPGSADIVTLGDNNPDFFGGLSNKLSYKGLTLDVFFQYQYGNESLLQAAQVLEWAGSGTDNQARSQLRRWTTPGQVTDVPRPFEGGTEPGGYDNTNFSSRFVETASYIRLKNVSLNYQLPSSIAEMIRVGSASFFVQGMNLATYTNYRGDDPENSGNNLNAYPNPRTITGGVTLEF